MQIIDNSMQFASVTEQQLSFISFITFAVIGFRNIFCGLLHFIQRSVWVQKHIFCCYMQKDIYFRHIFGFVQNRNVFLKSVAEYQQQTKWRNGNCPSTIWWTVKVSLTWVKEVMLIWIFDSYGLIFHILKSQKNVWRLWISMTAASGGLLKATGRNGLKWINVFSRYCSVDIVQCWLN